MKKKELSIQTLTMQKINGERINWHKISKMCYKADIDFLDEFHNEIHWGTALMKSFSEDRLLHIIPYITNNVYAWRNISQFQKLSTGFIEKYYKQLNKNLIAQFQKLDNSIILKHYDTLDVILLLMYQDIDEDVLDKIKEKIPFAESVLTYKAMYNKMLSIIDDTKSNVGVVGYEIGSRLEDTMQREIIRKLKTILRKMS